jgi:hypothetical protein
MPKKQQNRRRQKGSNRRTGNRNGRSMSNAIISSILPPRMRSNIVHSFQRTVSYNITLGESTGWGGVSLNDIEFSFSLEALFVYVGGSSFATQTVPGYNELTALYERWRIKEVVCTPIFSNNNSSINSPTLALPILLCVVDYDDVSLTTLSQIQQFSNLMVFQLGNGATGPPNIRFVPRAQTLQYNGSTSAYSIASPGTWFNTDYPLVPHYALKFYFDNQSVSGTATIGSFSFYFTFTFEMSEPN